MKQSRARERKANRRRAPWVVRTAAILVAATLVAGPLVATPISEPDTTDDDSGAQECILSAHDWWIYKVSEMLRAAGLMRLRLLFVFANLKDGRYECTG